MKKQRRTDCSLPCMWAILFSIILAISMFMWCKPAIAAQRTSKSFNKIYVLDQRTQKAKSDYSDGDFISIVINYSGEIRPRQKMTVNWDSKDDTHPLAYLTAITGKEKDIYLFDKNKNKKIKVGFCSVSEEQATIVINDNLPSNCKVDGFFSFNLQVRNLDNKEHDLKIRLNDNETYIRVLANNKKQDRMLSANLIADLQLSNSYIEWGLLLDKGLVEAELSNGQIIDPNSIRLKIFYSEQHAEEYSLKQLEKFVPDLKVKVVNNKIYFNLNTKQLSKYKIMMFYRSEIIDYTQVSFSNKVYFINNKEAQFTVPNTNFKIRITNISFNNTFDALKNYKNIESNKDKKVDYGKIVYKQDNKRDSLSHRQNRFVLNKHSRHRSFTFKEDSHDYQQYGKNHKKHRRIHHNQLPKTSEDSDTWLWIGVTLINLSMIGMLCTRRNMI